MYFKYRAPSDPAIYIRICIDTRKKYDFGTGSQRIPVGNKKRDLVTRLSRDEATTAAVAIRILKL